MRFVRVHVQVGALHPRHVPVRLGERLRRLLGRERLRERDLQRLAVPVRQRALRALHLALRLRERLRGRLRRGLALRREDLCLLPGAANLRITNMHHSFSSIGY